MKTKLVYLLTCAPQDSFIEQALMAIWSARHYNPDAHIVVIVDDLTDKLLVGKRGYLLDYVTEKIVVPFDDASLDPMYRSRLIKTNIRNLIKGDYLFIDCDTITMCDLSAIEQIDAEIAMGRDQNIDLAEINRSVLRKMAYNCSLAGFDILKEKCYFNSGVMFVKDTELTHQIYDRWHALYAHSVEHGMYLDQPAFARTNFELGRPVVELDNRWNCIVQSHIKEVYDAYILHFWHTTSFLYTDHAMRYIRENGLTDWIKYYILHPIETFIPPHNRVYEYKCRDYIQFFKVLKRSMIAYAKYIDASFSNFQLQMKGGTRVVRLAKHKCYNMAALLLVILKYCRVKSRSYVQYTNYFAQRN